MDCYGKELILDLHDCDVSTFDRAGIGAFFYHLCKKIGVERADLHFWDDVGVPEDEKQTDPKTTGTSAIQFILTSNVTVHTLDKLGAVYINIFSCEEFDDDEAANFCMKWFKGTIVNKVVVDRK